MKHPLTSKERRGLVAVAAAALLCIAVGPLVRFCSPSSVIRNTRDVVSASDLSVSADSISNDTISNHKTVTERKRKTKNKSGGKSKKSKTYPTRHPLDEEIGPEN